MTIFHRRDFLANVGRGMLVAGVGSSVAFDMGLASARAAEGTDALNFGKLESLVALMQDTPPEKLLPQLVEKYRAGTDLRTLTAAGALANARTFGGEDYIGYHTFMALGPAYEMARELPEASRPLPVLKVLHRNASRIQAQGGRSKEVLHAIEAAEESPGTHAGEALRELVHKLDTNGSERALAKLVQDDVGEAYQHLQYTVQDEVNVHRIVLSWRAWTMLDLAGREYAETILRQSVRFCLQSERYLDEQNRNPSAIREQLPKLFDQYKLLGRAAGTRVADDAWIEQFARTVYAASPAAAADAAAAALAEGISPESVGEGLSVAANLLVLHDPGRLERWSNAEKPAGSCHGDSVGVHASDAANAWRNIARVSNHRNAMASLIVGAYHTAGQSGGLNKDSYPYPEHLAKVEGKEPMQLLAKLDSAIRAKDQFAAAAVATRFAQAGGEPRMIFDLLLGFATSEDGALHAEKYYRTVSEEFARSRPAYRWRQVAALARVTASEFGRPAPGYVQGKDLLKV